MKKMFLVGILIIVVVFGFLVIQQFFKVQKAHSSFENYYAFRGCTKLLTKTATSATCELAPGKTIKIVNVQGKWYLDGDLPVCYFKFCL